MKPPRPGFCSPINKIVRVIDGDTLEIELTRKFNVRLVHENEEGKQFNSPELSTPEGKKVKKFVEEIISGRDNTTEYPKPTYTLFIPAGNDINLMDINSFNRILGEIWIDDIRNFLSLD